MDNSDDLEPEEREARIESLKRQAEELTGASATPFKSENCSPEIEEQFWEQMVVYEQADDVLPFDLLVKSGISLPPPDDLDDPSLTTKLWEVIHGLSLLGAYLEHTDHLSDRELYVDLWTDLLRQPTVLLPDNPDFSYHLDLVGSGSEEDNFIYLKYYADEDYRQRWAQQWPQDVMPEHEPLPYDRDRHLPRPTSGEQFPIM